MDKVLTSFNLCANSCILQYRCTHEVTFNRTRSSRLQAESHYTPAAEPRGHAEHTGAFHQQQPAGGAAGVGRQSAQVSEL